MNYQVKSAILEMLAKLEGIGEFKEEELDFIGEQTRLAINKIIEDKENEEVDKRIQEIRIKDAEKRVEKHFTKANYDRYTG